MKHTIHVRLADAPTDVLVHLADHGPCTIDQLIAAVPDHGTTPADTRHIVTRAVSLLRDMGLASGRGQNWDATSSGARAIVKARATQQVTVEGTDTTP